MSKALRYYFGFYRSTMRPLACGILATLLQPALLLPIPMIVRRVFDDAVSHGNVYRLLSLGGIAVLLQVAYTTLGLWVPQLTLRATKHATLALRVDLVRRLYAYSRDFHTRTDRAALHTQVVHDTERVDSMANAIAGRLAPACLSLIVLAFVLVYLNWMLSLVLIATAPLLYGLDRVVKRRLRARMGQSHQAFEAFSRGIFFVLQMMDLTRLHSAEEAEIERQRLGMDRLRIANHRAMWLSIAYDLVQNTTVAFGGIVIVLLGAASVAGGRMSVGDLMAFYLAFSFARTHIRKFVNAVPHLVEGQEALDRLYSLATRDALQPYTGKAPIEFRGHITLEAIRFAYDRTPVLDNVTLDIPTHSTVAIEGPNGCGKSTIAHLILALYRPQEGRLLADGRPYEEVDIGRLRRFFGVVPQDPVFFPGTILENITYGSEPADRKRVVAAAQLATAHVFIEAMPDGYDTPIGEQGLLLSGGQKQRIAIARALLRHPAFLILDEPTNHLDRHAVAQLLSNLREWEKGPTVLIFSHDRDVVGIADTVYHMREGRLHEDTSHGKARA